MKDIIADIYDADDSKTWTNVTLWFEKTNQERNYAECMQYLQRFLQELTVAHTYMPFLYKPLDLNDPVGMDTEPIDSELGSTFAALLAFAAARGKNEHPATLIKALLFGLVRYHHAAYLQDITAPAGDFDNLMQNMLGEAEEYLNTLDEEK